VKNCDNDITCSVYFSFLVTLGLFWGVMQQNNNIGKTMNKIPHDIVIELDLLNNTFLSKSTNMFGCLYKFKSLFVTSPDLTDIEADFLERQQVEENVYMHNCYFGDELMIIKKHIFNSLKILELTWHKIKTLENESIVNLSRLQSLGLSNNNQLATLSPDSSHHLYSSFITSGDHYRIFFFTLIDRAKLSKCNGDGDLLITILFI
jgi:hypothetical protein